MKNNITFSKLDMSSQLIASLVDNFAKIAGDDSHRIFREKWLKERLVEAIWSVYGDQGDFRLVLMNELKEELHTCFLKASKDQSVDQILRAAFVLKVDFWFENLHKETV